MLKNNINKKFLINDCNFPPVHCLQTLIEICTTSTYPVKILDRRLNLLNNREKLRVLGLWITIKENFEKIDEIIAKRAEIENDPWK